MKRAIIHCGMHKTGSTSIQQSLARLRTDTLAFADLGGPNHSEAIATLFLPDPETYNGHRLKGHSRRKVLELRKTWQAQFDAEMAGPQDDVIISAESLSTLPEVAVQAMYDAVHAAGRTPEFYAYVRDPIGYAASMFQQMLKSTPENRTVVFPRYRPAFQKFLDVAGPGGITLWPFSPSEFPAKSVVQDFATRLDFLDICPPEKRSNDSLSETAAKLVYTFNKTFPVSTGDPVLFNARMAMIDTLNAAFPGKSFKFPDGYITEDIIDWDDLAYLRAQFSIDFEAKTRSQLSLATPPMSEAEFDTWMRDFATDTRDQLAACLEGRGIPNPDSNRIPRMLARLYLHFVQKTAQPVAGSG